MYRSILLLYVFSLALLRTKSTRVYGGSGGSPSNLTNPTLTPGDLSLAARQCQDFFASSPTFCNPISSPSWHCQLCPAFGCIPTFSCPNVSDGQNTPGQSENTFSLIGSPKTAGCTLKKDPACSGNSCIVCDEKCRESMVLNGLCGIDMTPVNRPTSSNGNPIGNVDGNGRPNDPNNPNNPNASNNPNGPSATVNPSTDVQTSSSFFDKYFWLIVGGGIGLIGVAAALGALMYSRSRRKTEPLPSNVAFNHKFDNSSLSRKSASNGGFKLLQYLADAPKRETLVGDSADSAAREWAAISRATLHIDSKSRRSTSSSVTQTNDYGNIPPLPERSLENLPTNNSNPDRPSLTRSDALLISSTFREQLKDSPRISEFSLPSPEERETRPILGSLSTFHSPSSPLPTRPSPTLPPTARTPTPPSAIIEPSLPSYEQRKRMSEYYHSMSSNSQEPSLRGSSSIDNFTNSMRDTLDSRFMSYNSEYDYDYRER